MLCSN